jgi:hypothetical protein
VVLSDGEHHNATAVPWDFLVNRGRIPSLRLHPHAETKKKATNGNRAAAPDERLPGCFALEEERGSNWKGSGGSVPSVKEAKPSL